MATIGFNISLPSGWSKTRRMEWFSTYYDHRFSDSKAFEWQTDYFGWTSLFRFELDLIPTGEDHASFGFDICILGFMFAAKIYDSRHWDHDNRRWERYDQVSSEERDRDWSAEALVKAYKLVEADLNEKAGVEREAYLQTPEGQAEVAAEIARLKEEKRLRGLAHRAANEAKQ